jgi:hypothetical protein
LRESAAQAEGRFLELQSKLAAEAATASTDRLRLAESLSKTEALTSLNHKLTAALAVVQLRAAVGVQDLLSQVISRIFACSLYSCRSAFAGGVIRIV